MNASTGIYGPIGRLKPGVTRQQAESDLNTVAAQMGREVPDLQGMRIYLTLPGLIGDTLRGGVIGFAAVLMGLAGLVLLIACTNLASLLLARASDRAREIALRLALGAGRWRLVRQLLSESLLLSLAGAAGGLFLAVWLVDALAAWRPPIDIPITMDFAIDCRVLAIHSRRRPADHAAVRPRSRAPGSPNRSDSRAEKCGVQYPPAPLASARNSGDVADRALRRLTGRHGARGAKLAARPHHQPRVQSAKRRCGRRRSRSRRL